MFYSVTAAVTSVRPEARCRWFSNVRSRSSPSRLQKMVRAGAFLASPLLRMSPCGAAAPDRRTSRALTGCAVAGLAVLAGCIPATPDPRGVDRGETLLTVTGTGRAEAALDQALFTAGLSSIAPSAEAASTRSAEPMNWITAALAKLRVPARDIQTRNLSVNGSTMVRTAVGMRP